MLAESEEGRGRLLAWEGSLDEETLRLVGDVLAENAWRVGGRRLSPGGLMVAAGLVGDVWQEEMFAGPLVALDGNGDVVPHLSLVVTSRQAGKTTGGSFWLAGNAVSCPGTTWIVASPSWRQSVRVLARIRVRWRQIQSMNKACAGFPMIVNRALDVIQFDCESQILALPANAETIRGETAHGLLIEEAAYVGRQIRDTVSPFLAATGGPTLEITSAGVAGSAMHDEWLDMSRPGVTRIEVPWQRVPRISPGYIAMQRRSMSKARFEQEFECKWHSPEGSSFRDADIRAAAHGDVPMAVDMIPGLEAAWAA